MAGKTLFDKIWDTHSVMELGGSASLVAIDRILLHERTGGIALKSLSEAGRDIRDPKRVFVTMDHVVDTLPGRGDETLMPTGRQFIEETRAAAKAANVTLFDLGDPRQGIVHVISPEQAIVLPGATLVCPDSHTCTQGALGALAWGIGSSEAEHALATSTLRVKRPDNIRITIDNALPYGVTAKDMALHIVAEIGSSAALGCIIEFAGDAVNALHIEARMTLCNMATELGAFSAIIAPDENVFDYLKGRPFAPKDALWDKALSNWRALFSDADADFAKEFRFDAAKVRPMVSWGTSPEQSSPLGERPDFATSGQAATQNLSRSIDYMDVSVERSIEGLPIDAAFIGSCTNARLSDLQRVAAIVDGHSVAPNVRAICVPGSGAVKLAAEAEGIDQILLKAGFEWREPGCSMCFFAGGESFGERERVISSTNRNFENRQGRMTRTHIASPETVAASALAGRISMPNSAAPDRLTANETGGAA